MRSIVTHPDGLDIREPVSLDRIYLLWTFGNFRVLPKQALNRRQQHSFQPAENWSIPDSSTSSMLIL